MPASITQADGSVVPVELAGAFAALISNSFARPANTTAYAAGQLMANSVSAASVVAVPLPAARLNGGTGLIPRVDLAKSDPSLTNASFRVHLYSAAPTSAAGDGVAYSTNGTLTFLDTFDVNMVKSFTDGAKGVGVPSAGTAAIFAAAAGSQNLYALVEALAAYTPASGEVFTITLQVLQN